MTMTLRAAGAALICVAMTGQAWAAGSCLKQADLTALRASALQQQLMVAAFTCHDSESYNRFVLAYRGELQASDAALMAFFQHRNPATGTADYHTFKTKLANVAAIRSSTDTTAFCAHANAAYNVALGTKTPLATLVSSLASASKTAFNTCPDAAPKTIIQAQGPAELPKAAANLPPIAAPTTSVAVATLVKSAPPAAKAPKAAAEKPAGPLVLAKAAAPKAASKVPQQPLELDDPLPHPDRIVVAQADIASAEDTMAPLAAAEPEQALNDRAVQDLAMDEDVMTIAPQTPTRAQVAQPAARPPYRDRYAQAQPRRENTYDGGRYENSDDDAEQGYAAPPRYQTRAPAYRDERYAPRYAEARPQRHYPQTRYAERAPARVYEDPRYAPRDAYATDDRYGYDPRDAYDDRYDEGDMYDDGN